jgi:hypothetical protein
MLTATPIAITHTTEFASASHASDWRISVASGVGKPPANANVVAMPSANAIAVTVRVTATAAGIRARNSAVRERPVSTLSRNTPPARSPAPASAPIRIAATGPMKMPRRSSSRPKLLRPPAGP